MGKVHRIKKSFWRTVATIPWHAMPCGSAKYYRLAHIASITAGKRYDGSCYVSGGFWGSSPYHALLRQLINEYNAGVAQRDIGPVEGSA